MKNMLVHREIEIRMILQKLFISTHRYDYFFQTQCMYIWIDGTGENVRAKTKTVDFVPKKPEGMLFRKP